VLIGIKKTPSTKKPSYEEEAHLLKRGFYLIAGVDEAGRGPLAGPVVAGVAMLSPDPCGKWVSLVRDSKLMTPLRREEAFDYLSNNALSVASGVASPNEIDRLGIVPATQLAVKRAIKSMILQPQFLLMDAFPIPTIQIPQKPIVHGDTLCFSIAAASIIAKVTRDRLMDEQHLLYPEYGFTKHKGYGTKDHIRLLAKHGPSPIHRHSFSPIRN
jgi:ribonuclease HII